MPNVGDIIRASDVAIPAGSVIPFYNVTLSGRYPIFWGQTEADTGWVVCDGGSDLHGGTVPNLTNRFIMGTNTVSGAEKTGGSTTTSSTSTRGTVGATTITSSTSGSHQHIIGHYYYGNGGNVQKTTPTISNNILTIDIFASSAQNGVWSSFSPYGVTKISGSANMLSTSNYGYTPISTRNITTGAISGGSGSHTHSFTGSSHTHTVTPPYYSLIYLVKLP